MDTPSTILSSVQRRLEEDLSARINPQTLISLIEELKADAVSKLVKDCLRGLPITLLSELQEHVSSLSESIFHEENSSIETMRPRLTNKTSLTNQNSLTQESPSEPQGEIKTLPPTNPTPLSPSLSPSPLPANPTPKGVKGVRQKKG